MKHPRQVFVANVKARFPKTRKPLAQVALRASILKTPPMAVQTSATGELGTECLAARIPATSEELLGLAKIHIERGESSRRDKFKEAAEFIAQAIALDQKLTQRRIAETVGKSAAWVNRLLRWREGGYEGAPFADMVVHALNKPDPQEASKRVATRPAVNPLVDLPHLAPAAADNGVVDRLRPADGPAKPLRLAKTDPNGPDDYHIPALLNRQDPERAFHRLQEQWLLSPFRDLFLDLPKAAQDRFVREVLLNDPTPRAEP